MSLLIKFCVLLWIVEFSLGANILISPIEAMKYAYGEDATIGKKNILLSSEQVKTIEKNSKVKLNTKIFRIFSASKEDKILGYGILINKTIRSKNAVILYFITSESVLKSIEIIAFNEPPEYLPSKKWNTQFENISTDTMLKVSKEIPVITGATLSSRSVVDGSREAFGIYNTFLKGKE